MMRDPRHGYMCAVDYQHELGHAQGGNIVYASIEDLKRNRKCVDECGIVQVEVRFVKWEHPQNFDQGEP